MGEHIDGLVDDLNSFAVDLLKEAKELKGVIENGGLGFVQLEPSMKRLCFILTQVIEILESRGSLLRHLVRRIAGIKLGGALDHLEAYLREHRATLVKLGVADDIIERVLSALRDEAVRSGSASNLQEPQTLSMEDALSPLKELRDVICKMAHDKNIEAIANAKEVLVHVIDGVIGGAIVVVDITAAFSAGHEPTGWVLFKSVKSVWAGATKIRKSVKGIVELGKFASEDHSSRSRQGRIKSIKKMDGNKSKL